MLFNYINENIIAGFLVFLTVWFLVLTALVLKALKHYQRLVGTTKKKNLQNILEEILRITKNQEEETEKLKKRLEKIEKNNLVHLQKIGFLRFNPFSDTGGDQSFVLSFLDAKDNGIVLNSLHNRGTTRIYAKEIKKGEGHNFKLSKEEKEAINKAKKRKV